MMTIFILGRTLLKSFINVSSTNNKKVTSLKRTVQQDRDGITQGGKEVEGLEGAVGEGWGTGRKRKRGGEGCC